MQRIRSRLPRTGCSKNSLSVPFVNNEIEIVPVSSNNVVCLNESLSTPCQPESDSALTHQLPDIVSNKSVENTIVDRNSSEYHILPDAEVPNITVLSALGLTETLAQNKETKDLEPNKKDSTILSEITDEAVTSVSIEKAQVNESELSPTYVNEDNQLEDHIGDNQVSKDVLSTKPNEENCECSIDDSSPLVIEKVTSLTNQESGVVEEGINRKDQVEVEENGRKDYVMDVETVESGGASIDDEDSREMRPDIVMCDTPMVSRHTCLIKLIANELI